MSATGPDFILPNMLATKIFISFGKNPNVPQLLGYWVLLVGAEHQFHYSKRNYIALLLLGVPVLVEKKENPCFERDESHGEKYYESRIPHSIYTLIADCRGVPFGASVQNQPDEIKHNAD